MVPLEHVLALSTALFVVGAVGALVRRNLIVILLSIEVMLNAVNLALVGFNRAWAAADPGGYDGQVLVLLVVAVAAAEAAVGLGILIALVRNRDSLDVETASLLRW